MLDPPKNIDDNKINGYINISKYFKLNVFLYATKKNIKTIASELLMPGEFISS